MVGKCNRVVLSVEVKAPVMACGSENGYVGKRDAKDIYKTVKTSTTAVFSPFDVLKLLKKVCELYVIIS